MNSNRKNLLKRREIPTLDELKSRIKKLQPQKCVKSRKIEIFLDDIIILFE